jgi:WW domain
MMLDVIQQVYQKIRDPASNCFYYFDTRTGQSTWTKPKILGKQDIPETKFSESESEGEEGEEEDGEVGNAETATLGENPAPTTTDVEGESKIEEEGSLGTDATMMDSGLTASSVLSHDPLVMSFGQPN